MSTNLSLLKRRGVIDEWQDRKIEAGQNWRERIYDELAVADIILLLVSPDFLASDFAWGEEVTRAMNRHDEGTARVIPIILRPVNWHQAPFGSLQALPADAKPVTLWDNRDQAWLDITDGISAAAEGLATGRPHDPVVDRPHLVSDVSAAPPTKRRGARLGERPGGRMTRTVHDARHTSKLPGTLARAEGDLPTGDEAVDDTYDNLGATYSFFWNVYGRDSLDGRGSQLPAVVHYQRSWNNAAWTGGWLLVGDGDGRLFNRFSSCIDVIGHELTHAVIETHAPLVFWGQSGSLSESIADVFGSLIKQYSLGQAAAEADWLVGAGLFADDVQGVALRSMSDPGTAYDDPVFGKDQQIAHMRDLVQTTADNGGVYINVGIPNRAFYLVATALGGYAWERAGRIWYEAVQDPQLQADAQFPDFAGVTQSIAQGLYGGKSDEALAVKYGWALVGVKL